jgi:hypothetical protein
MSNEPAEDYLMEDAELPSQKVVLLSFLSPEKILANKDIFMFKKFLVDYEMQWKTTRLEQWMAEQIRSLNAKIESLAGNTENKTKEEVVEQLKGCLLRTDLFVEGFQAFVKENMTEMKEQKLQSAYEDFLFANSSKLEEEFFALNEFRTTMRGIKVRGVFSTEAEASIRAKRLQKSDPSFNIYLGSVGKWMAWEPDPNKVGASEYANDELNSLMKKYRENEEARDQFYNEQKRSKQGTVVAQSSDRAEAPSNDQSGAPSTDQTGAPSSQQAGGAYDGLFSGPADLAMQRKAEVAAAKAASDATLD